MGLEQVLDLIVDEEYDIAVASYLVENEDMPYKQAAEIELTEKQAILDAEMDAAFSSEDEEERLEAEGNQKSEQDYFMEGMMKKYKMNDEIQRGLTPKETDRRKVS